MIDERDFLERALQSFEPQPGLTERVYRRREQKRRNQRIRAGVLGLAIAIGVGWLGVNAIRSTPSPADRPTPSPGILRTNGEVLTFTGNSRLSHRVPGDLVVVNPETGEERALVEDLRVAHSARWSADGRWVAYETEGADGWWQLWVVSASQEPRLVATGENPAMLRGHRVVLVVVADGC